MSKVTPKKKTYLLFRRYMSGITVTCVIVTIIASMQAEVSVTWIAARALLVCYGIGLVQWFLIRIWGSVETTQSSNTGKSRT